MTEAPGHGNKTIDVIIPAFNPGEGLLRNVEATLGQTLPAGWTLKLVVVDDGSGKDIGSLLRHRHHDGIAVVRHAENRGRSAARNTGFSLGQGVYVVFLDADCVWQDTDSLSRHIACLERGADVSVGLVDTPTGGFWGEYQRAVFTRRIRAFAAGDRAAMTSANIAVRRVAVQSVGGFDEGYRHYGFEDRDLFLRLLAAGRRIFLCQDCRVLHEDTLSLAAIAGKMHAAGRHSAGRFRRAHPAYYAGTPYHRLDAQAHGYWLRALAALSRPLLPSMVALGDRVIASRRVPRILKRVWVKVVSGLAYLHGTHDALNAG